MTSLEDKLSKALGNTQPAKVKTLTSGEVSAVLAAETKAKEYRPSWPSVRDLAILLDAIKEHKEMVEFSDGTIFKLRYSEGRTYPSSGSEKHFTVYVSPLKGFVPCGWYSIDGLKRRLGVS